MKKVIVFIVSLIFIVSIVAVSFYGLEIASFERTIYVEKIDITNSQIEYYGGYPYIVIDYNTNYPENNIVQIEYHVYPENATSKMVKFVYDETTTIGEVSDFGAVTFYKVGVIAVTITATDGSSVENTIRVAAL